MTAWTFTETRTQEDLAEIQAAYELGCKCCETRVEFGDWYTCVGDPYCGQCAKELRNGGSQTVHLPTRAEQAATLYAESKTEEMQGYSDGVCRCWIDGCGDVLGASNHWLVKPLVKPAVSGPDGNFIAVCLDHAMKFGHTGEYEVKPVHAASA
jgi:hypothetical protein